MLGAMLVAHQCIRRPGRIGTGTFEIVVPRGNAECRHGDQRGRLERGKSPLQEGVVRRSECSDLSVAVRQRGRPLDGIKSVFGVVRVESQKGFPLPIRRISPASILSHNDISGFPQTDPVLRSAFRREFA